MKKNIGRIVGALFLAFAILLWQVPAPFAYAVSGGDFQREGNTVYAYNGTATSVTVPSGTLKIASEAFSNQDQLKSVSFPASLEEIGNGAFRNCTSITDVVLPSKLAVLESGAFAGCESLHSFRFNDTLTELGAGVFSGDDALKTLDLGKNPYFVLIDGALYNRDKTKLYCVLSSRKGASFTIPDSVTEIERYAFWGCHDLREVTLCPNLYEIPEFAFSNCENLETVNIPLSVRKISAKAFEDCISLGDLKIPASVTTIHDTAFDGCSGLRIISEEGTVAYEFYRRFDQSQSALMEYEDLSVSTNALGGYYNGTGREKSSSSSSNADTGADGKSVTDGDSAENLSQSFDPDRPADLSRANAWDDYSDSDDSQIGSTRVVGNKAVIYPGKYPDPARGDGSNPAVVASAEVETQEEPFPEAVDILSADSKGLIPRKAYYDNSELTDTAVSEGAKQIGDLAFARSTVTSVALPEGLERIGYGAFYHCDNLKQVKIPDSVTYISPECFSNTPYLDNWLAGSGDDFLIVGDGVLIGYRGSASSLQIPDTVKMIAGGSFAGHEELQEVKLGNQVRIIGEGAFYDCTALRSLQGGNALEQIADRAFMNCPVDNLHIPASVQAIGLGAFDGAVSGSVIFEGQDLPQLSYEQTSTRLANDQFRSKGLGEIPLAVFSGSPSNIPASILDENYQGFRGLAIAPKGSEATLLRASAIPDETGTVKIPEQVSADGKTYRITGASPSAFSAYDPETGSLDCKRLILPAALGSAGDYIPSLAFDAENAALSELPAAQAEEEKEESKEEEEVLYVETVPEGTTYPDADLITAKVKGDTSEYFLYVSKDRPQEEKLRDAITEKYGQPVEGQLNLLSLSMVEKETNVPITNFGNRYVQVKIPVSETLYNQQICAVSLTEDGKLEMIYGTKAEEDGKYMFTFRTNHFSPYGIYAGIGAGASEIAAGTAAITGLDESPDTGDHSKLLTVVIIFFAAAGLFLLLYAPAAGKRKTSKTGTE
ncbi:MAG: leucine-rich repeat domain-containing protein [Lachnospiraceae bacterium]|nr:leucine-rich repeat domain-containing protein [Lachnospiraceae bacterium]